MAYEEEKMLNEATTPTNQWSNNTNKQTDLCETLKNLLTEIQINLTMASAEDACSQVIQDIRETCLNFQVQETPYSAFICLRKSFKKGSVTSSQKKAAFSTIKNLNLSLVCSC